MAYLNTRHSLVIRQRGFVCGLLGPSSVPAGGRSRSEPWDARPPLRHQDAQAPIGWAPLNLQLYFQFILEKQQALQEKKKLKKKEEEKKAFNSKRIVVKKPCSQPG